MSSQTGENEQALRKILDMTRLISIVILVLHFYYYCYSAFQEWGLNALLSDRLLSNIYKTGLFNHFNTSKWIAAGFLLISLIGSKGKKGKKQSNTKSFAYIIAGLTMYLGSYMALLMKIKMMDAAVLYIGLTSLGFLLMIAGGTLLSRIIN